jgi:NADH-quinone oxidoreductase subunit E
MIAFSPEKLNKVNEIIARYPQGRQKSALLPVLHLAQTEFGGWLDVPVMDYVASLLSIEPIEVYEVASFTACTIENRLANLYLKFVRPAPA